MGAITKYLVERRELINKMMDIALYLGRNPMADDFEDKVTEHERLKTVLDSMVEPEPVMGRPVIGITRKQSLTLPEDAWEWIDQSVENGHAKNRSEFIRNVLVGAKEG